MFLATPAELPRARRYYRCCSARHWPGAAHARRRSTCRRGYRTTAWSLVFTGCSSFSAFSFSPPDSPATFDSFSLRSDPLVIHLFEPSSHLAYLCRSHLLESRKPSWPCAMRRLCSSRLAGCIAKALSCTATSFRTLKSFSRYFEAMPVKMIRRTVAAAARANVTFVLVSPLFCY